MEVHDTDAAGLLHRQHPSRSGRRRAAAVAAVDVTALPDEAQAGEFIADSFPSNEVGGCLALLVEERCAPPAWSPRGRSNAPSSWVGVWCASAQPPSLPGEAALLCSIGMTFFFSWEDAESIWKTTCCSLLFCRVLTIYSNEVYAGRLGAWAILR